MKRWVRTLVAAVTAIVVAAAGWLLVVGPALDEVMVLSTSRATCFEGVESPWIGVGIAIAASFWLLVGIHLARADIQQDQG